jgi:hypothetical protein
VENFSLSDELAKQKLTLQDINEFLTNELKARSLAAAQASLTAVVQTSSSCFGLAAYLHDVTAAATRPA